MSGFDYFKKCITTDYANFNGRARRSEYWYFVLFTWITIVLAGLLFVLLGHFIGGGGSDALTYITIPLVLIALGFFIPILSVAVRRLHDTNKSGWFLLLQFIPLGGLVIFVFNLLDGTKGPNNYGDDPKMQTPMDDSVIDDMI